MAKIWVVACGNTQYQEWKEIWPDWKDKNYIAIGCYCNFPLINDQGIKLSSQEITENGGVDLDTVNAFAFNIQIGDYAVIKVGRTSVLGLAKIIGDIEYSEPPLPPLAEIVNVVVASAVKTYATFLA